MISLFEKNLKRMKQELTDLKTVHERGFGTIRFFKKEDTFDVTGTPGAWNFYSFEATIATGESEWPVWQPFASSPSGPTIIRDVRFSNQTATKVSWQVITKDSCTLTTGIISSSVMQGVQKT